MDTETTKNMDEVARVSDIMRVSITTVSPDDSLEFAAQLFEKYNYEGFPVIDHNKKLVGIVTAYDMILQGSGMHLPTILNIMKQASDNTVENKALDEHFKRLREIKIREVMNIDPLVVGPDIKVEDLAKEFAQHHRVNPIPVVDGERRLLGIVSRYDLIRFFNEQYFKKVMQDTGHGGILQRLERVGVDGYGDSEKGSQDDNSVVANMWLKVFVLAAVIIVLFLFGLSMLTKYQ